jgi:hypothetical protein
MLESLASSRFLTRAQSLASLCSRLNIFGARLDSLSIIWAIRKADMKTLHLFAAAGEAHFQFEAIIALEVLTGAIERDESRHFDRQALFDVSCFEHRTTHRDGAVFGRNGEPYRRQRTGGAIGTNAAIDADAHLAPRPSLDFAIYGVALAVAIANAAQQSRRGEPCYYSCLLSRHSF